MNADTAHPTTEVMVATADALPRPNGAAHSIVVGELHDVVAQVVPPKLTDAVVSDPKFIPWTVTVAPPVGPALAGPAAVRAGESNEKELLSVPTVAETVTAAVRAPPEKVPETLMTQRMTEAAVHEAVAHKVASIAVVGVGSSAAKFSPIRLSEQPPVPAALRELGTVTAGASKEKELRDPTRRVTVKATGFWEPPTLAGSKHATLECEVQLTEPHS